MYYASPSLEEVGRRGRVCNFYLLLQCKGGKLQAMCDCDTGAFCTPAGRIGPFYWNIPKPSCVEPQHLG